MLAEDMPVIFHKQSLNFTRMDILMKLWKDDERKNK